MLECWVMNPSSPGGQESKKMMILSREAKTKTKTEKKKRNQYVFGKMEIIHPTGKKHAQNTEPMNSLHIETQASQVSP